MDPIFNLLASFFLAFLLSQLPLLLEFIIVKHGERPMCLRGRPFKVSKWSEYSNNGLSKILVYTGFWEKGFLQRGFPPGFSY